tara:strand:- start:2678 stop:2911 length:234 start_codon:yes stop_codon:yes gene_type:complete
MMNQIRRQLSNKRKVSVNLRDGNDGASLERALRELKRKLKKDGFYKELRRREYFISPSEEKKLKRRRKKSISGEELT